MRPKAGALLESAKRRAFEQIAYALKRRQREGDPGQPFRWYTSEGEQCEALAYCVQFTSFRLCEFGGDEEQPCYFNQELRRWDTVYNLPTETLISCADDLIVECIMRRMNRNN